MDIVAVIVTGNGQRLSAKWRPIYPIKGMGFGLFDGHGQLSVQDCSG